MRTLEPSRSRLYLAAGALFGATIALAPALWVAVTVLMLAVVTMVGGNILQYWSGKRRRQQFTIRPGAFLALRVISPGLNVVVGLAILGVFTKILLLERERGGEVDPVILGIVIVMAVITALHAFLAWQPLYVALTPQGVEWHSAWHRRLVPWDALAPGGPPGPGPLVARLTLAVTRPEAVTIRGVGLFAGSAAHPMISSQFDVHPQLMAAAIRWYVEHPEHRAGIGTQAEHNRLVSELRVPA